MGCLHGNFGFSHDHHFVLDLVLVSLQWLVVWYLVSKPREYGKLLFPFILWNYETDIEAFSLSLSTFALCGDAIIALIVLFVQIHFIEDVLLHFI